MAFTKESIEAKRRKIQKILASKEEWKQRYTENYRKKAKSYTTRAMYEWYSRWKYEECNTPPVPFELLSEEEVLSWRRLALLEWRSKKINGKNKRAAIRKAVLTREKRFIVKRKPVIWIEYESARCFSRFYWYEEE